MLLVQAVYDKDQIQLKHIWFDKDNEDIYSKVFALKSTSLKEAIHVYMFSKPEEILEAFIVQIDVNEFKIVET